MSDDICDECLPDAEYRRRMLGLTVARRDAIRNARLVVLSRYMATELAVAGLPDAEVIPPWVEVAAARETPGSYLLLAGRLVLHKAALDGWRAWRASAVPLTLRVAGDGPLGEQLEGSIRLGWLPTSELSGELRGALALLFPAFWQEPFGILGVQALVEGTPVIVAGSGGTVDWSDRGCIRVAAGDVDGMAVAIRHLSRSPTDALRLGREGQVMVADRFARRIHEARLHAVYEKTAMK